MPRRKRVVKREVVADSKYNSQLVTRIMNCVMQQGKKSTAEHIVYGAFAFIEKQGKNPMDVFKQAVENIKPLLELKTRRIGGANYQIPVEVSAERRQSLAIRWLLAAARERKEKVMLEKLAQEIMAAAANQGGAIKKREDVHKMAEANRAFAHYRW
jgi:small subunit ribosomal protein S7